MSDDSASVAACAKGARAEGPQDARADAAGCAPQGSLISPASWQAADALDKAGEISAGGDQTRAVTGMAQFEGLPVEQCEMEVHGTAVAVGAKSALFIGRPGSGKSAQALSMIALGAKLVADDRVVLRTSGDSRVMTAARPQLAGLIEARGIGLVRVPSRESADLSIIVDMDQTELRRLPPKRTHQILTKDVHLVFGRENWSLGPALIALLQGALVSPSDP